MTLTLRQRIALTWLPLFILLVLLGGAAAFILRHLGGRIEEIMRENYRSVVYMKDLNEALERVDSSLHIALAGRLADARAQYADNWRKYRANLSDEQENITLPGERELVDELISLSTTYEQQGDAFLASETNREKLMEAYFKGNGLRHTFNEIKRLSDKIRAINQDNMLQVRDDARQTAHTALWGIGAALVVGGALAVGLGVQALRAILFQVNAMTESATAVGRGDLDQIVPAASRDELGALADAFNTMTRQLREYRQSQQSRFQRIQKATQATVDAFPNPVLVLDARGHIEMANPAANCILGVSPETNVESSVVAWEPPSELRQPLHEAMERQQAYVPEGFDRVISRQHGDQNRVFLPRLFPIRDSAGATLGVAVLLEDVTRFRLLDEVKSNLVATVSHELKTPLTSIRLAVHLLLEETVGPLTPKQLELVIDARDNAERLLAMINNLLDLARHERGAGLDVAMTSPAALLRAAADANRPRADDKGVELGINVAPGLPLVSVDSVRMGNALQNLVDNALAFTERGGRVTLSATADDGPVTLSVTDTGIGIPEEHLPHVFDRFFRVPGQSRAGGTGLGLAIVREVVAAHGGTVSCVSRVGKGTEFRISLPAYRVASATIAAKSADNARAK
jgi:PAS domain S-box-containing protein